MRRRLPDPRLQRRSVRFVHMLLLGAESLSAVLLFPAQGFV
jgi:hypothetical protein